MADVAKRLNYVDMVKGLAIVGVVLYHLVAPSPLQSFCTHLGDALLAIFFMFSGYFYRPGKRTVLESIKSRVGSLLGPFVRYSSVFWVIGTVYLLAVGAASLFEALCCLRNFYAGCIWNRVIQDWFGWEYYKLGARYLFLADFWFLIAMFLSSCLFFPLADRVLDSKGKTLASTLGLFAVTGVLRACDVSLPYNMQLVPFWTALMLVGAFAGREKLFEIEGLSGGKEWACALAALVAGVALALWKAPSANLFRGNFAATPAEEPLAMVLCIAASLLISWGLGELCKLWELAGLRVQELAWLGSHSLIVYLFHMFFAWVISIFTGFPLKYEEPVSATVLAQSVALTAVVFALCIARAIIGEKIEQMLAA